MASSKQPGSYEEISITFPSTPTHPLMTFRLSVLPDETITTLYQQLESSEAFHTVVASRGTHLFNLFHIFSPDDLVPKGPSLEPTKTLRECGVSHGTQLLALRQPQFTPEYSSALEILAARKEAELEEALGAKSPFFLTYHPIPTTPPTFVPSLPRLAPTPSPSQPSPSSPPPPPPSNLTLQGGSGSSAAGRVVTKWPWSPTLSPYPPPIKSKVEDGLLEGVSPLLLRPVRGGTAATTITTTTATATTNSPSSTRRGGGEGSKVAATSAAAAAPMPIALPFPPPMRESSLSYKLAPPSSGENKHPSVAAFQRGLQVDLAAKKLKEKPWLVLPILDERGYR